MYVQTYRIDRSSITIDIILKKNEQLQLFLSLGRHILADIFLEKLVTVVRPLGKADLGTDY